MYSPALLSLPPGVLKILGMLRKQKMFRRWLWSSPAGCHDCMKLELPGAWEPRTARILCHLVKMKRLTLVFLMETKVIQRRADFLRVKLGFQNMFCVDCRGRSGGLMLLWGSDLDLEIQNFSQQHVNAIIKFPDPGFSWKFTSFFGNLLVSMETRIP